MAEPGAVPACIKSLSNTTFVAEVKAPALAVLVPLLQRALNDRSMEVQRRTVIVIDNLVKLVRDPRIAATYLSSLVDGVEKIATGAAFPEVRSLDRRYQESTHIILILRSAPLLKLPSTHSLSPERQNLGHLQNIVTSRRKFKKFSRRCIPCFQKKSHPPHRPLLTHPVW
jgi:hypothetical protein